MRLAREASVELNIHDLPHLQDSSAYLPAGTRVYVSHLPRQSFNDTLQACAAVKAAGFEPVPHVPVRLLEHQGQLDQFVSEAANIEIREMLLISGDFAQPRGPFGQVADVLRSTNLPASGIKRVSIGGHPEGHSSVSLSEIRSAELEKYKIACDRGLHTTFVTQFFFESTPFLQWAQTLRSAGVTANIRAGLAGPAKISTLLKYAVRCGVGSSIRALASRPTAIARLLGEHGPEDLLMRLAATAIEKPQTLQGIHVFCFGGYLRTCRWLQSLAEGQFKLVSAEELSFSRV